MENNKYKNRCPGRLSLSHNRYQPYFSRSHTQINTSPVEDVSRLSPYCPSPIEHLSSNRLPLNSPLTPSCAFFNTSTPKFRYPEDLLPPTSIFTASIARDLLEEEHFGDSEDYISVDPVTSHNFKDILSLPLQGFETNSYDLFTSIDLEMTHTFSVQERMDTGFHTSPTSDDLSILKISCHKSMETCIKETDNVITCSKALKENGCSEERKSTSVMPKKCKSTKSIEKVTKSHQSEFKEETESSQQANKRFQCEYCPKKFAFRDSLYSHTRIHTGEKPYQCKVCQKCFTNNSTYVKHMRTHTKEKPYICDICHKSFSQSGNLLRHKRNIHKNC